MGAGPNGVIQAITLLISINLTTRNSKGDALSVVGNNELAKAFHVVPGNLTLKNERFADALQRIR